MVLVDTSVWIDFFAERPCSHVTNLEKLIMDSRDLCTCWLVLAEVLQGIRNHRQYRKTRRYLENLLYLPMNRGTYIAAADIYRELRGKGITIRKPVDCMIAATALAHAVPLLHNDRDFLPVQEHYGLRTVPTE